MNRQASAKPQKVMILRWPAAQPMSVPSAAPVTTTYTFGADDPWKVQVQEEGQPNAFCRKALHQQQG